MGRIAGKTGVEQSKTNKKYANKLGQGNAELFVQFLTRIYFEIPNCKIAQFSTLKTVSGPHFEEFRKFFKVKFNKGFICPSKSFDNVKGKFPIGFMIWDTSIKKDIKKIRTDVYDLKRQKIGTKYFYAHLNNSLINDWVKPYRADPKKNQLIGKFPFKGSDFQNQEMVQIVHNKMEYNTAAGQFLVNQKNVLVAAVYIAVRKCIQTNWIINGDQFLHPNKKWETDATFQSNCFVYTLFTNKIQCKYGTNHWIPFTEKEINAREKMESNFMSKYISGKVDTEITYDLFSKVEADKQQPITFTTAGLAVFEAGKQLWKYYHAQPNCNVNAAYYDIREHFQGRNEKGRMNNTSTDQTYWQLLSNLRYKLSLLVNEIEPKIYEYEFLKP